MYCSDTSILVSFAVGLISQSGGDEDHRGWFSPLFDPATKVFAEVGQVFKHVGMAGFPLYV